MELDEVYTVRTIKRDPKDRELKFETALEHLCTLKSLENVSYMLSQINFSQLEPITEISVFKKGIMPLWEDPANSNGAQWNLKFSNDISERIFQKFLISFITTKFESLDINGIVYSARKSFCYLSIWSSNYEDGMMDNVSREILRALSLPIKVRIYVKPTQESLKDSSSFRKNIERTHENEDEEREEEEEGRFSYVGLDRSELGDDPYLP